MDHSVMKLSRWVLISALLASLPLSQAAEKSNPEVKASAKGAGKETSILIRDSDYQFRLKTQRKAGLIHVYSLGSPEPLPDELSLKLFDGNGNVHSITLKSANPNSHVNDAYYPPSYSGKLDPNAGSIMGVELQFGLKSSKIPKTIKWKQIDGPIGDSQFMNH